MNGKCVSILSCQNCRKKKTKTIQIELHSLLCITGNVSFCLPAFPLTERMSVSLSDVKQALYINCLYSGSECLKLVMNGPGRSIDWWQWRWRPQNWEKTCCTNRTVGYSFIRLGPTSHHLSLVVLSIHTNITNRQWLPIWRQWNRFWIRSNDCSAWLPYWFFNEFTHLIDVMFMWTSSPANRYWPPDIYLFESMMQNPWIEFGYSFERFRWQSINLLRYLSIRSIHPDPSCSTSGQSSTIDKLAIKETLGCICVICYSISTISINKTRIYDGSIHQ